MMDLTPETSFKNLGAMDKPHSVGFRHSMPSNPCIHTQRKVASVIADKNNGASKIRLVPGSI
ncbi:uncharacterized protein Dsimw501_GD28659 [Drosophila simulans]|nr:uncharacterized protein Dsimw501_GD28659 [Drosophila simulans]